MNMNGPRSVILAAKLANLSSIAFDTPPGNFAEVGVYQGGSAFYLAKVARKQRRELHLYDTFSGMPHAEEFDTHKIGDFGNTSLASVQTYVPDAIFHPGVFPETLTDDVQEMAFVHCDCDQYRSVLSVIDCFWPRMVSGGIIAFDDMDTIGGRMAIHKRFDVLVMRQDWALAIKP
jgi:O-methyltransferase